MAGASDNDAHKVSREVIPPKTQPDPEQWDPLTGVRADTYGRPQKGEGYYQVVQRDHPELPNTEVYDKAHEIKAAKGGRNVLKVNERLEYAYTIKDAADQMRLTGESPEMAVATLDNSAKARALFPNDLYKQNAAYRIMMHDMKEPGYPEIAGEDAKRFTPAERSAINKYVTNYKPAIDIAAVEAAAQKPKS